MSEKQEQTIALRSEVKPEDCWDLSSLYSGHEAWAADLEKFRKLVDEADTYRGKLGESADLFARFLIFYRDAGILGERLGYYAFLRYAEDAGDSENQARYGQIMQAESAFSAAFSFVDPEIQAVPDETMQAYLEDERIKPFSIMLNKLLRFKPHILTPSEEKILALQSEAAAAPQKAFQALTDVDMDFGRIETEEGSLPLSHGSFSQFLISPDRDIRERAYRQFYRNFHSHANTLAALFCTAAACTRMYTGPRYGTSVRPERLPSFPTMFLSRYTTVLSPLFTTGLTISTGTMP